MPSTTTQPTESTSSTRQTTRIAPGYNRCQSRNRSGSRCRHHAAPDSPRCSKHALCPSEIPEDTDLSVKFGTQMDDLSTAVHINSFLTTLVQCVVKNEISPRRAAVIGYLTNQIIRTLPAIEHELNPPADQTPIFDFPIPYSAQATEKHAADFAAPSDEDDDSAPDHAVAGLKGDAPVAPDYPASTPNKSAQQAIPPTPPPTPTFSRSQHQPNEYPVYHDPNYDDHWYPTGHLINPPLTTTPNPAATAIPEAKQRKPAA